MSKRGFPVTRAMREKRRAEAKERQDAYDQLTLQQKLNRLPPEPAAAKQRAKLLGLPLQQPKPEDETKGQST